MLVTTESLPESLSESLSELGKAVIRTEEQAIHQLYNRIDNHFENAVKILLACKGRTVVLGMGKSGHIAKKIAATLASTGTPAFYVHPAEACHGDMGMITKHDVVLAISYSGETSEVINILPLLKNLGIPLIALTGHPHSTLARYATEIMDISVDCEACPLGLAPTASTTATLVMGDALAVTLLQARGFTTDDFARAHPGGILGRRLLLRLEDIMHVGNTIPKVDPDCPLDQALVEITQKSFGMTTIVNTQDHLLGVFTDGDLRRALDKCAVDKEFDMHRILIHQVMTKNSITVSPQLLAVEALKIMQERKITTLVIVNSDNGDNKLVGIVHMHDLLRAGII